MRWSDISLLDGWFPMLLACLALAALGIAVVRRRPSWWLRRVLPICAAALLAVIVVNRLVDVQGRFGESVPSKFLVWVSMPLVE